jgi:O-antigen ligase
MELSMAGTRPVDDLQRYPGWARDRRVLLKVILLALAWCAITASWPGREPRAADEIYDGSFDFTIKFQVAAWAIAGTACLIALRCHLMVALRMLVRSSLRWYAAFAVVALCSVVWSVSPVLTCFRALQLFATLLFVVLLIRTTEADPVYTLYFCYACTAIMALAAGACWILVPSEAEGALGPPVFRGTLAIVAAISAAATIPRVISSTQRHAGRWAVVLVLLTAVVVLGRSRGVLVVFVLVAVPGLLLSFKGRLAALFLVTAMACVGFAFSEQLWDYFNRADVGTGGDVTTLNGRLPLWIEILSMQRELPVLGHGFVAGSRDWFVDEFVARGGPFAAQHAHNAWLNALIETGLPGLFCILMLTGAFMNRAARLLLRSAVRAPLPAVATLRAGFALVAVYAVAISVPWHGLAARAGPILLPMLLCCYWIRPALGYACSRPTSEHVTGNSDATRRSRNALHRRTSTERSMPLCRS